MNLRDQLAKWEARGADGIVGSLLTLNVRGVEGVRLHTIRNAMLARTAIPVDWAPEAVNMLTVYLETMASLGRSQDLARKFLPNAWGEYEIDPGTHRQYVVTRMKLERDAAVPTAHKVLHLVKDLTDSGEVQNIEADRGIQIHCRRIHGTKATDADGTSIFEFEIYSNDGYRISAAEEPRYLPFLRTLEDTFANRCAEVYGSAQIRQLVQDIFHKHLNVVPVNHGGLYFVESDKYEAVQALSEALREVDPGILITNVVVPLYRDETDPSALHNVVSDSVATHLQEQMAALITELETMKDSEGVRPSTWEKRAHLLQELAQRAAKMQRINSMNVDTLREQYHVARALIIAGQSA